jgi:hypothetical protein
MKHVRNSLDRRQRVFATPDSGRENTCLGSIDCLAKRDDVDSIASRPFHRSNIEAKCVAMLEGTGDVKICVAMKA